MGRNTGQEFEKDLNKVLGIEEDEEEDDDDKKKSDPASGDEDSTKK